MTEPGLGARAVAIDLDEQPQVLTQVVMAGMLAALDRGFLDIAVYPLDLTIRPRAVWLRQLRLDLGLIADQSERMQALEVRLVACGLPEAIALASAPQPPAACHSPQKMRFIPFSGLCLCSQWAKVLPGASFSRHVNVLPHEV